MYQGRCSYSFQLFTLSQTGEEITARGAAGLKAAALPGSPACHCISMAAWKASRFSRRDLAGSRTNPSSEEASSHHRLSYRPRRPSHARPGT